MAITYTTTVSNLVTSDSLVSVEGTALPNAITTINWVMTGVDSVDSGEAKWVGRTDLDVSAITDEGFVLFGNLEAVNVIAWIESAAAEGYLESIKAAIANKIEANRISASTVTRDVPW